MADAIDQRQKLITTIYAACLDNGTAFDDIEKMDIVRYIHMAGARMHYKRADEKSKSYKYIDEW